MLAQLILQLNYITEHFHHLIIILQFYHPVKHVPHGKQDGIGLFLGVLASCRSEFRVLQSRLQGVQPAFQFRKHFPADFLERIGNARLQSLLEFLGIDAIIDQLHADVIDGLGHSQSFLGIFAAIRERPLHPQHLQGKPPLGRIGRSFVAGFVIRFAAGLGRPGGILGFIARIGFAVFRFFILTFRSRIIRRLRIGKIHAHEQIPGFCSLLNYGLESLPQHQFAGLKHHLQLIGGNDVQQPAFAGADVGAFSQAAQIGRLDG